MADSLTGTLSILRAPGVLEPMLRTCALFRGLAEEELGQVMAGAQVVARARGEVIFEEGTGLEEMYVLLRGRIVLSSSAAGGARRVLGHLGPGDHFGELGLLTGGKLVLRSVATSDVVLLALGRAAFEGLMRSVPAFAENLSRALGFRLATAGAARTKAVLPGIVGVLGASSRTRALLQALGCALGERGAPFVLVTEEPSAGFACTSFERLLGPEGGAAGRGEQVQRIVELRAANDLVLLALEAERVRGPEAARMTPCEELWWVLEPATARAALDSLGELLASKPGLADRMRLVWALREGERPTPGARAHALLEPEYRVFLGEEGRPATRRERISLRRVVACLEGQRLGLALGGGGARGFAHCGVLEVLEEEGLAVDRIAGTSSGALLGFLHAAGTSPAEAREQLAREARAPFGLGLLPKGEYLGLWLRARSGAFERSLRSHYGSPTFEELDFPFQAVTSDLVRGEVVVRESGDCVDAILESINLPIIARPILRAGRALVDGGVLNNLPTDLLREKEIEAVIGVDVMSRAFDEPTAGATIPRRPGLFESLLRIAELQHARLTDHGAGQADLVLRVPTQQFALADFSAPAARAIAAAGAAQARASVEALRTLIPARWRGRD